MDFQFELALREIRDVLASGVALEAGMARMLDFCAEQYPHPVWNSLRQLDFAGNMEQLKAWFGQVLCEQPVPARIRGLWFGLCNPHQDGRPTCMMYLAGSAEFDARDRRAAWVIEADYFPRRQETLWMAPSICLQEIHHKAYAKMYHTGNVPEYGTLCDYTLCLGFAALAVRQLCAEIPAEIWLGDAAERGIATGFDDGDFLMIARIGPAGVVYLFDEKEVE